MAVPSDYRVALKQINDMERALKDAVRSVMNALRDDGRIDIREGIDVGMAGLMMGMNVAAMLKKLSADGAEHLLYVLEHSERVMLEEL